MRAVAPEAPSEFAAVDGRQPTAMTPVDPGLQPLRRLLRENALRHRDGERRGPPCGTPQVEPESPRRTRLDCGLPTEAVVLPTRHLVGLHEFALHINAVDAGEHDVLARPHEAHERHRVLQRHGVAALKPRVVFLAFGNDHDVYVRLFHFCIRKLLKELRPGAPRECDAGVGDVRVGNVDFERGQGGVGHENSCARDGPSPVDERERTILT